MGSATGEAKVTFSDFSGGDYGEIGGAKAPKNTFKAQNMLVTADGFLMPRPGWKDRSPTDLPVGKVTLMAPTSVPTKDMMIGVADDVYTYNLANAPSPGASVSLLGTFGVTPTYALYPKAGTSEFYVTIPENASYKLDVVGSSVDELTDSPGGREIELYGLRLVVATTAGRIIFSEPDDPDSWPSENFIDIGDKWDITALREQNNHLSIFKSRGKHVLTGIPGVNPIVRKTERSRGVLHPGEVDIDEDDMMWFIPWSDTNPASFDGNSTKRIDYLKNLASVRDGDNPALPVVRGVAESVGDRSPSTLIATQGGGANRMLLFHNGVWTFHATSITISGMCRGGFTGDFYVTDGGGVSASGKVFSNTFGLNRPAFTIDGLVSPGDNSNTPVDAWVKFPQYWSPDGTELRVEEVIVDFVKYNTGTSETSHFDIDVFIGGRSPEGQGEATGVTYPWDETVSGAGASIGDFKSDRKVQGCKTAKGSSFEIQLRNVRNVKIKTVTVVTALYKSRPEHQGRP